MALRILVIQWLVILLVIPVITFGVGHLLHVSQSEIWHTVILARRNLLIVPVTLLFAGRTWFAARYEGYELKRRSRSRAA
jgi:hypothetical protein